MLFLGVAQTVSLGFNLLWVFHAVSFAYASDTKQDGIVVHSSDAIAGKVVYLPQHKEDNIVKASSKLIEIETESKHKFKLDCYDYKEDDPVVFVYTTEGILMETLTLYYLTGVCDKLEEYIIVENPNYGQATHLKDRTTQTLTVTVTYAMSGKIRRCIRRKYLVTDQTYWGAGSRTKLEIVDCPQKLKNDDTTLETKPGIVNLAPSGTFHDMNYIRNLDTKGEVKEYTVGIDTEKKSFKIKCRDDKLHGINAKTQATAIATAVLVHQDDEEVVLDKLQVSQCTFGFDKINVNGKPAGESTFYRIVYKHVSGQCYSRDMKKQATHHVHYYQTRGFLRNPWMRVRCPKVWTGDIGLNENIPWYKRLFNSPQPYLTK